MGKISTLDIKETELELREMLSKQVKSKNRDRIKSLLHIQNKKYKTRGELSIALGYHKRTMERWLSKYITGGVAGMLIPDVLIRESQIVTPEIHESLSKRVYDPENGFSSYVEAHRWVIEKFKVEISYHWLRTYMIKSFKTKIKQPRKSHIKKDDQAVETFLKTT